MAGAPGWETRGSEDLCPPFSQHVPLGLDVVFECCGQQEALDQAVALLRPGGKLMIIGIPEADHVRFDPDQCRRKEITIVNVRRQRGCVQTALDLIESHQADFDDVDHTPLSVLRYAGRL